MTKRSVKLIYSQSFADRAQEYLPERPVGEMHAMVVLGLARPPRTPSNRMERHAEQQEIGKVE
jgi:hypothetical protein